MNQTDVEARIEESVKVKVHWEVSGINPWNIDSLWTTASLKKANGCLESLRKYGRNPKCWKVTTTVRTEKVKVEL